MLATKETQDQNIDKIEMVRELCLSCQDCERFIRHYIKLSGTGEYTPISRGHCASVRRRSRSSSVGASDLACNYIEPKNID